MLVIHPADSTTYMLAALYSGQAYRLLDQQTSSHEIRTRIRLSPPHERIMLLGHGCPQGLFSKTDDDAHAYDRLIINHRHAYHLRQHGSNLIGIWCHARLFAEKENLHGLFSGMIISELEEAQEYGLITTQQELDTVNTLLFTQLRALLDRETPLHQIPSRMTQANNFHTPLADFNYNNFFYL